MKYITLMLMLSCLVLPGCMHYNNDLGSIGKVSSSIKKQYPLGITFVSGDIGMRYTNQQRIMGSIEYPDQKDIIVLEGYGKGTIKQSNIYFIPGVYGNISLSGSIIYTSGFSFSGPNNDSERRYTRTYMWTEKEYREELSFTNWRNYEYGIITILPQSLFSGQISNTNDPLESLCTADDDMFPLAKEEYKRIGTDKIYIGYRDDGGLNNKTTIICFLHRSALYLLQWTDNEYRKDIVDSFTFL